MMRPRRFSLSWVSRTQVMLVASTLFLPGCGDSLEAHPPVYPVTGKVKVSGKPMGGGTIIFEYADETNAAPKGTAGAPFRVTGKISAEGAFKLNAYPGSEGVPKGSYKVGIVTRQGRSENVLNNPDLIVPKLGNTAVSRNQFADPKTSGLTANVSEAGPNEQVFDLK
jgi:hypothetical protein